MAFRTELPPPAPATMPVMSMPGFLEEALLEGDRVRRAGWIVLVLGDEQIFGAAGRRSKTKARMSRLLLSFIIVLPLGYDAVVIAPF